MKISKIFMMGQVLGFLIGIGTAHAQFAGQTSLMLWSTPKDIASARKLRAKAWVMAEAGAGGGPAQETPAQANAKVIYFERAKISDSFSENGVLFDGNGGALTYKINTSRREGPGYVEIHRRYNDVIYVLQGAATFVTGGTALDVKSTTNPDELQAGSIKGGETWHLKKGDIIIVPKGVPHWFKEVQGTVLNLIVKVR